MLCACGCGQQFTPSAATSRNLKSGRITKAYMWGHLSRVPVQEVSCGCGCGGTVWPSWPTMRRLALGEIDCAYLPGHAGRGPRSPVWRGGIMRRNGRVYILRPDHPNAQKAGYILRSRLVMSEAIGRALTPVEFVHHLNGDRTDDRLKNLCIMDPKRHNHLHNTHEKSARKYCVVCGKMFVPRRPSEVARRKCCSKKCAGIRAAKSQGFHVTAQPD